MAKDQLSFVREHPLALLSAYLFLVLFANMYGFWRPFGVNVFAYANVLELFTNAALYVGQSVILLTQVIVLAGLALWFLIILFNYTFVPFIAKFVRVRGVIESTLSFAIRRPIAVPTAEFSLHVWVMRLRGASQDLQELVAVFMVLGLFGLAVLANPYNVWVFVVFVFLSLGITVGAQVSDEYAQGWRKTLTMVLFAAMGLLPAICYARGSYVAEAVRRGCGTVRYLEPYQDVAADLPVYLGHVGDFVFLFDDRLEQEIAKGVGQESEFRLAYVDRKGNVLPIKSNAFGLYRSLNALLIPDCRDPVRR